MKHNRNEEAVSPVIGVILMVAITVVLAAIVFVLVTRLSDTSESTPNVSFTEKDEGATLMVASAPSGLDWADFTVDGCTTVPTGSVDAGDLLEECVEAVTVSYVPSNSLVFVR